MRVSASSKKGVHFLVISVVLGLLALTWLIVAMNWGLDYLKSGWIVWFGIDYYDDSPWRTVTAYFLLWIVPTAILGIPAKWAGTKYYYLNFASIHELNLLELEKAGAALQQSISSVKEIDREVRSRLRKYQTLEKELDDLRAAKGLNAEILRKTLNAIALSSRRAIWWQRLISFLVGVLSSMLAAAIWDSIA